MAFGYFSACLLERGIKGENPTMVKEAHRMGQVCEKISRMGDFYGGSSVALFQFHVSHWKRRYVRTLQPVLSIYNAQLDAGDFFHVEFTIWTYINLHIASGYSIKSLKDNLELFDGLYHDYKMVKIWRIAISMEFVANMLGETDQPLIFFGDTVEEQEQYIGQLQDSGEFEALDYLTFVRLYMAIFFNDFDLAEECLTQLSDDIDGVWIPWYVQMKHLFIYSF